MARLMKVAKTSNPNKIAGAISNMIEEDIEETIELEMIGAGAVNQAVKGITIAQGHMAAKGLKLLTHFGFTKIDIDGQEKTGIKAYLEFAS